eukprot:1524158-Rhodomonas_salina.1
MSVPHKHRPSLRSPGSSIPQLSTRKGHTTYKKRSTGRCVAGDRTTQFVSTGHAVMDTGASTGHSVTDARARPHVSNVHGVVGL